MHAQTGTATERIIHKGFINGKKNESQNDTFAGRLKEIREEQQSNNKVRFEG